MSEKSTSAHTEDLQLEGSDSDAIVGGAASKAEIAKLRKEGYLERASSSDGIAMFNPRTKKTITVKY
ncbi:MAG TPA: hypothetical protein VHX88_08920 [Solirubrobacteraceae bacterium]|jgi:hypothetical protein|nr:hypothetical protein [Solirubrobacteraceae bacterium]